MATGWPFWAATSDERIETAFDLAGLQAGDHLVDLGCGDGRVLLRAADRGARVTGIEIDRDLAAKARQLLTDYHFTGEVVEGDIASELHSLTINDPPDVVFAYLSPATLQRLSPALAALPAGTRVVVTGWTVPGWDVIAAADRCFLYRMPPIIAIPNDTLSAWESEALVVAIPAEAPSLVATRFRHPGGAVRVAVDPDVVAALDVLAGVDSAAPGEVVALDLRWKASPAGMVVDGAVTVDGVGPFEVLGIIGAEESGMWGVTREGMAKLRALLEQRGPAAVLAAARDSTP